MRKLIIIPITITAIGLAIYYVILPFFFPWSPICSENQFIDINTGKSKRAQYLLYIKVSESIGDTAISSLLNIDASPNWHPVNTFSPGIRYSPHYYFHGAFHQINQILRCWSMCEFSDDAKKESAKNVLKLWQTHKDDYLADKYISALFTGLIPQMRSGNVITTYDLPPIEQFEIIKAENWWPHKLRINCDLFIFMAIF